MSMFPLHSGEWFDDGVDMTSRPYACIACRMTGRVFVLTDYRGYGKEEACADCQGHGHMTRARYEELEGGKE